MATDMTAAAAASAYSSPALLLQEDATDSVSHVVVHPLVLLSVLDHHTRRQEADGRVIGTLLGRRDGNKVEVTNCFAVPHAERGDEVAIGKDFNKQMLALHLRANRKEVVVGWYASCSGNQEIADTSSLIHEFYASEVEESDPIHITVDTRLLDDSLKIRAYKSTPILVQGEPLANLFHEVRLSMESREEERIALDRMTMTMTIASSSQEKEEEEHTSSSSNSSSLQVSMEKLLTLLETASTYVNNVVEGSVVPDAMVGRQIADTLAAVPRIRPEIFDKIFQDSLQDLLMVTYLSNITQTQLTIAEKLNATMGV